MAGARLTAIVNPAAGGGRCGREAARVLPELAGGGLDLDIRVTGAAG